jgi:hypothetical protein
MEKIECYFCGKEYKNKSCFKKHLKSKLHLDETHKENNDEQITLWDEDCSYRTQSDFEDFLIEYDIIFEREDDTVRDHRECKQYCSYYKLKNISYGCFTMINEKLDELKK